MGSTPARVWAALLAVWTVWGTTYLAIRVVDRSMPPLLTAGIRFLLAGALLFAWTIRRGDAQLDRPTGRQWRAAAIGGTLLLFGGNGFVMLAERTVPSGLAALILALVPIWMALFDRVLYSRRLGRRALTGLTVGFLGAALLVWGSGAGRAHPGGTLLLLGATISWTIGSLYLRQARLPSRALLGTSMEMLAGGAVMTLAGVVAGELQGLHPGTFRTDSVVAFAYLVVFGSLVGFTCFAWLIRSAPTSLVSTYAYVNPVVAVLLGALILGERLTVRTLVAGGIVVLAVVLIVSDQRLQTSAPAGPAYD